MTAGGAGYLFKISDTKAIVGVSDIPYSSFSEPDVIISRNGVLATALRVGETSISLRGPAAVRSERTRCYNGGIPGPTLEVSPGDELRIRLINQLGPNQDSDHGLEQVNGPHGFNTTNLHTHGLHVSPQSPGDNPFLAIEPGSEYHYTIRLPQSHPPGTFWYHPHSHGSTALQVMNGMAGALIVLEPPDQQITVSKDLVWMIQEIAGREAENIYTCHPPLPSYTVNGNFQPTLRFRTGELQRWRFINATATPGGYADLQLLNYHGKPERLVLIAVDGYSLREMQPAQHYVLPPGGRVDFLARLDRAGRYQVKKRRVQGHSQDQTIAWIAVSGSRRNSSLPTHVPSPPPLMRAITDDEIRQRRILKFQMCPDQARGDTCSRFPDAKPCSAPSTGDLIKGAFLIDGKPYDPGRTDHSIKLGTAEEWQIINETGSDHPFHIHVNHFQVVRADRRPQDWLWSDTISLPADGAVKIRIRFNDHPGRSVLHCHILLHSDMGMMQNFEVIP